MNSICVYKRVDISIMVKFYASDVIEYGRRTLELSNAPLHMKQDNDSRQYREIAITLNPRHTYLQ